MKNSTLFLKKRGGFLHRGGPFTALVFFMVVGGLVPPFFLHAEDSTPPSLFSETVAPDPVSFPVGRVVLSLVVVMGGLYLARPLLKRGGWGGTKTSEIEILGRVHVTPKAGLCLARARGRCFLLGVGPTGLSLLSDLGPDGDLEPAPPEFSNVLKKTRGHDA